MNLGLRLAVAVLATLSILAFPAARSRAQSVGEPVPRVIIALWDSASVDKHQWRRTLLHMMAEMPLNYLGLVIEPHDINAPLPDLSNRSDVRGVLTWFEGDSPGTPAPAALLAWAERAVDLHKRYISLGNLGFADRRGERLPLAEVNHFLQSIGLQDDGVSVSRPIRLQMLKKDTLIGFERPVAPPFPGFEVIRRQSAEAVSHLVVDADDSGQTADLVVTGPNGGYVAPGYTHFYDGEDNRSQQWLIDPFAFFRLAFATDDLPKPDVTTIVGRRIYYSEVDGDGGLNLSEYGQDSGADDDSAPRLSSEVLADRVIKPHPELPVTIAPIAAELDPEWFGNEGTQQAIRALMALPQVEAGTHTFSHPYDWSFFSKNYSVAKEARVTPDDQVCGRDLHSSANGVTMVGAEGQLDASGGARPRAYACQPFDLDREIAGSVAVISRFLPPGKKVEVLQWSGNTDPYAEALRRARLAGLPALNGGDARFDPEFPSVSWVPPVGCWVDGEQQIYASASNENLYTFAFRRRYYGIKYVTRTWDNTETPRRLKPMDLYYHFFSGDKEASVDALLDVIKWLEDKEFTPIRTSLYARIAEGFYSARLVAVGPHAWRVSDRGALQTVRIDDGDRWEGDLVASTGVLGWRHEQGSLYVALDPTVDQPIFALRPGSRDVEAPFLKDSRWQVSDLKRELDGLRMRFAAHGYGPGQMRWAMPKTCATWNWLLLDGNGGRFDGQVHSDKDGEIELNFPPLNDQTANATIACAKEGG